jgi:hypothetical protein
VQILVPNNQIWNAAIVNHPTYKRAAAGSRAEPLSTSREDATAMPPAAR